ncbi:hypothetical protein OS493_013138 [Desmophyllum pertusum]|uniref:Folate receptor-like domain-containing protein n=1 Tax=Desmophyllum pertusum TaxID=174260 RepID=A0A9X0CL64_9CNID|nr:hypothetical protein OS493_013138 [Desmophyllum pertusum]
MKRITGAQSIVSLLFLACCGSGIWRVVVAGGDDIERTHSQAQYCPYFKNRGPSKQDNLRNCSWYKENSCCHDEEIEFAFQQLTPLVSASSECAEYMNYLYCYICAPNQNTFFKDFTLTVCEEFCDRLYSACKNAELKGRKIKYIYKNGKGFCKGRRFEMDKEANGRCFTFNPELGTKSTSKRVSVNSVSLAVLGMFTIFAKYYVLF